MSPAVILLVLASAFVHASWNAILKRTKDPEHAVIGMSVASGVFAVLVGLPFGLSIGSTRALGWTLAAGLLEAAYFRSLARALARAALGPVYTVSRGGSLLVVWPISVLVLGEPLTPMRALGTGLVLLGLAATGFGTPSRAPASADEKTTTGASGLAFAALTALLIGGYSLAYKMALSSGASPFGSNALSLGIAAILNLVLLGRARRANAMAAFRAAPFAALGAGFLGATGFVMFLAAMANAGAGVILTLRNTSILFAQGFAFLLGERPRRLALVGTALVACGAALLSLR